MPNSRRSILRRPQPPPEISPSVLRIQAPESALPELRIDYATYNRRTLLIRSRGLLEMEFTANGTTILGSNPDQL